jgi:UPF0716 protein FxsA
MLLALMILVFIVVPFVELWLIIMLADWLGGGWQGAALTVALLVIDSVIGALLLRGQGVTVFGNFLGAMRERRVPHREAVDGVFVAVGGALLLTPGFLTDILGFALLIPPSRRVFTAFTTRRISKRVMSAIGVEGFQWQSRGARGAYSQPAEEPVNDEDVVDVVAVEEEIDFRFDRKRLEGP